MLGNDVLGRLFSIDDTKQVITITSVRSWSLVCYINLRRDAQLDRKSSIVNGTWVNVNSLLSSRATKEAVGFSGNKTCEDQHELCGNWSRRGFCSFTYSMYMREHCPKSCKFCGGMVDFYCQGRNQLMFSGSKMIATCTKQINMFLKISGGGNCPVAPWLRARLPLPLASFPFRHTAKTCLGK